MDEQNTTPTRIVPALSSEESLDGFAILDVVLAPDKVVLWHWSYGSDEARRVTGYSIIKEVDLINEQTNATKDSWIPREA